MDRRLEAELRHHLEEAAASYRRQGASEEEARRLARLDFGGVEGVKEECREARGTRFVETLGEDVRFALRTLAKSPVLALTAIGTLALGIGATTAVFQVFDGVFLRDLPVREPGDLVTIDIAGGNRGFGVVEDSQALSYALFSGVKDASQGLSDVFAWADDALRTGVAPETRDRNVLYVSGALFPAVGVPAAAGRLIEESDDQRGCKSPGVVLHYGFWQREFGGSRQAIGKRIVVADLPLEIIGVAPPGFDGLEVGRTFDYALPLCGHAAVRQGDPYFERRDVFWLHVMGRVKQGWTRPQVTAQLRGVSKGLMEATAPEGYPARSVEQYRKSELEALAGARGVSWLRTQYRAALLVLLGLTGLILLIACANLASLMLARASSRRREFALRMALGGSPVRLLRQALAEGTVMTAAGAGAALLVARVLSRAMVAALDTESERVAVNLTADWRMLAFTMAVAVVCCLIFALAPALHALGCDPGEAIKSGGRGTTIDRKRFSIERMLIVFQVATSVVLVTGALLLVGTFRSLMTMDPGFYTKGMLIASFDLSRARLADGAVKPAVETLVEEVRAIPRVEAAAATSNLVIRGGSWTLGLVGLEGASKFTWVSPGYFETVGTRLIAGRGFTVDDRANGAKVAVVNETFVRQFVPGGSPLGKRFRSAGEPGYPEAEYEIVGVCRDTRYFDLRETPPPQSYAPIAQHPAQGPWTSVYVRTAAPTGAIEKAIRQRLASSHPAYGVEFRLTETDIRDALVRERLLAALSGFLAILATALAAVGLYGVIAYIASWRRKEVGIRMVLGASRAGIVRLFLLEAGVLVGFGVLTGVPGALVFARVARSLLFGVRTDSAPLYGEAVAILLVVAIVGSYLPARRAAGLSPAVVLQED